MRRTDSGNTSNEPPFIERNRRDPHHARRHPGARHGAELREDPDIEMVDMATLVQIARAIEDEAVKRYAQLAALMVSRGEPAVAAAFRVMLEEEERHVAAVDQWAASVGDPPAAAADYEWSLPDDLSSSWEDVAGSALLTPYRAFALAVDNEVRAFSFYAYLAAHAETDGVRMEAEKLGAEELRHAALLRRWRRRAYHRERAARQPGSVQPRRVEIESVPMLRALLAEREAEIATAHAALARRLESAGDAASARALEEAIPAAARRAGSSGSEAQPPTPPGAGEGPGDQDPRHLLVDAQKPLEEFADELEAVMATAEGELFQEAAAALSRVIERIAEIAFLQTDG